MSLIDELQTAATRWTVDSGRSHSRLATLVVNDGKFFDRLASGAGCTVATFERFMRFFGEPANWTHDAVPADMVDRLAVFASGSLVTEEG